jgi:hypothetical protein
MLSPLKSIKSMNLLSLKNMTLGPALQLSVYIGRYYCSFLPEGSLSLYFYAFKAFDAFKGTFMFVFLTKFFSNIQKQNYHDAIITFKKYSVGTTLISLSLVFFLGGVVLLDRVYPSILIDYEDLMKIIKLSLYSSIILICYPILTLYQRLVVSFSVVNLQFYSVAMMLIFQIVVGFVFLQLNILSIKNILIILSTSMIIPTFFVFKIELFKNIK